MADRIEGGRKRRINGLTLSEDEGDLLDRAIDLLPTEKSESQAEYIRKAALMRARRDLGQASRDRGLRRAS